MAPTSAEQNPWAYLFGGVSERSWEADPADPPEEWLEAWRGSWWPEVPPPPLPPPGGGFAPKAQEEEEEWRGGGGIVNGVTFVEKEVEKNV